jgi:hypothetical protein
MLTGKRFRLNQRTLAVEVLDGVRNAITIPSGAIIEVLRECTDGEQTVDVLWGSRSLEVFTCNVRMRGEMIVGQ